MAYYYKLNVSIVDYKSGEELPWLAPDLYCKDSASGVNSSNYKISSGANNISRTNLYFYLYAQNLNSNYVFKEWQSDCPILSAAKQTQTSNTNPSGKIDFSTRSSSTYGSSSSKPIEATIVLKVNSNAYYIAFDSDGGAEVNSVFCTKGSSITLPGTSREGFTFVGWSDNSSIYQAGESFTPSANTTLFAVWSITVADDGWYPIKNDKATYESGASGRFSNNTIVIPSSSAGNLTVTLPDRVSIASLDALQITYNGMKYYSGVKYTIGGYGCVGGTSVNISGSIKGFAASVAGNRTESGHLYHYEPGNTTGVTSAFDFTIRINAPKGYLPYGFLFGKSWGYDKYQTGYHAASVWTQNSFNLVTDDHPLCPIIPLLIKVFSITFNPNGGTGGPSEAFSAEDGSWTCPTSVPTRSNYAFKGWATSVSATVGTYVPGKSYPALTSDLTLYAIWSADNSTLIFNPCGGTVSTVYKAVDYNSTYGTLPTPTRPGYTFLGWYTASAGGSKVSSTTKMTSTGNIVLYAHWQAIPITITFDPCGGSMSTTSATVSSSTYPTLPTPTRPGYTFLGWFSTPYGAYQITAGSDLVNNANHTIYAQWDNSSYSKRPFPPGKGSADMWGIRTW